MTEVMVTCTAKSRDGEQYEGCQTIDLRHPLLYGGGWSTKVHWFELDQRRFRRARQESEIAKDTAYLRVLYTQGLITRPQALDTIGLLSSA